MLHVYKLIYYLFLNKNPSNVQELQTYLYVSEFLYNLKFNKELTNVNNLIN